MRPHVIVLIIGGMASLAGIIAFVFGIAQIGDLEEDWNDFAIEGKENGNITIKTPVATNSPLRTPPIMKPSDSSKEDNDGIRVSTMFPLTLETSIEVEVLAKEF